MFNLTAYVGGYSAPKEKPHGAQNTEGPTDTTAIILPPAADTRKRIATLTARLALHGHVLVQSNSASGVILYHITLCGMEKVLPSLEAVEAFLRQIGGAV